MRIEEFKDWLKNEHQKESTWRTYFGDCKRIYAAKGDLDLLIESNEHLKLLEDWRSSKKEGKEPNLDIPHGHRKIEQAADGFIQALKNYLRFYDASSVSVARKEIEELADIESDLKDEGSFDPTSLQDARDITLRAIVQRRGQDEFRKKLLEAYEGRCAISKTGCVEVLEAAHIIPYRGENTNHIQNGILLRSDLHTLFDLNLLHINDDLIVEISDEVVSETYRAYHQVKLSTPTNPSHAPSLDAIKERNRAQQAASGQRR